MQIGTTPYILSAGHVLEGDTVLGGNRRKARSGDPIIQPGLIDEQCNRFLAQSVGILVRKRALATSNTDCAIASVIGGMVQTDGAILGIGTISRFTAAAALNQPVQKKRPLDRANAQSCFGIKRHRQRSLYQRVPRH